jgi:hypothetical protein
MNLMFSVVDDNRDGISRQRMDDANAPHLLSGRKGPLGEANKRGLKHLDTRLCPHSSSTSHEMEAASSRYWFAPQVHGVSKLSLNVHS